MLSYSLVIMRQQRNSKGKHRRTFDGFLTFHASRIDLGNSLHLTLQLSDCLLCGDSGGIDLMLHQSLITFILSSLGHSMVVWLKIPSLLLTSWSCLLRKSIQGLKKILMRWLLQKKLSKALPG